MFNVINTVVLTTNVETGVSYSVNGGNPYYLDVAHFKASVFGIMLTDGAFEDVLSEYVLPAKWTINGVSGFETNSDVLAALNKAGIGTIEVSGIARGEFDAVLSDTEELARVGWIQPRLAGGTIKYVTEYGETLTRVFDQKEVSLVKVKQVFLTGTTANLGITVFYE